MIRYVSPAEYQRLMRERQRKVDEYNRKVAQHSQKMAREIDAHNRKVDQNNRQVRQDIERYNQAAAAHNREIERRRQEQKRAIDTYNREVRAHNARVIAQDQRRRVELQRLSRQPVTVRYEVFRQSVVSLDTAYERLERHVSDQVSDTNDDLILGLPAQENANSIAVMNALLADDLLTDAVPAGLQQSELQDELRRISIDLDARWRGALFALSPQNPDAARHFCTSAREIITHILDLRASDADVITANPSCGRTKEDRPTRRAKVQFILSQRGIASTELGDFVDEDINNVLDLFQIFNSATHGAAGKYDMAKLLAIKKRVEGGILFLSRLAH
ncbi:pPIWI-associating nuclease domain-containing protein [Plastoroseomonas hellenica]|uniref:pPIWI-associating nuclease domain-containing protein n=1 Tax=Plastoroseomonas hellenica TaxID=2687306 RepID=UPI001BA56EA9|nr:hypothetical protein [Plastoroseomonas hellenica]MBR0644876.1 hypothetical protein [Plastoroseomonas hellenica]